MRESQRRFSAGVALLLANTAYLAAFASPTPFYFANVVGHVLLGLGLAIAVLPGLLRSYGGQSITAQLGWALLGLGTLVGIAIVFVGAAGRFRWLLPAHIALMIAGLVPLVAAAGIAALRQQSRRRSIAGGVGIVIAGLALLIASQTAKASRTGDRIDNPETVPASMEEEGAGRPVLSLFIANQHGWRHSGHLLHDERDLRPVSHRDLQRVEIVGAPLFVFQQPVVPEVDRVHAGCRGDHAVEVVRGVPRSCRLLQRPLRSTDQGAD
jgi:hypothetical protein